MYDSTITVSDSIAVGSLPDLRNPISDGSLSEVDTVYRMLTRLTAISGKFMSATIITDQLLNLSRIDGDPPLTAILVQAGEGDYEGVRDEIRYEFVQSVLVVMEPLDSTYRLLTLKNLGTSRSAELVASWVEAESLTLTDRSEGVLIESSYSDLDSAGTAFRTVNATLLAFEGNEAVSLISMSLEDAAFSGDGGEERLQAAMLSTQRTTTHQLRDLAVTTTIGEIEQVTRHKFNGIKYVPDGR